MKNTIITSTLLILLTVNGNASAQNSKNILDNIQQKIHTSFATAQQKNSAKSLKNMSAKLENLYKKRKQNSIVYWQAYTKYYTAIYYFTKKDKKQSEKEIDLAVEYLESIKNKTSEDYALLSLAQGFSIQFKNMVTMIFLSKQIHKNGELAIEKDSKNLRGYYALASNDFYTPKQFGGGKKVEKYLQKAISLPVQKIHNIYLPSWGKKEAYELLVRWYIGKKDFEKAQKYHKEAIEKYPHSYLLQQVTSKLKNTK